LARFVDCDQCGLKAMVRIVTDGSTNVSRLQGPKLRDTRAGGTVGLK
jgi:hypothetical protein